MTYDFDDMLYFLSAAWYLWDLIELWYFDEGSDDAFGMSGDAILSDKKSVF